MKKLSAILAMLLCMSILAGCAGTPVVYYSNCTCEATEPAPAPTAAPTEAPADVPAAEGELLTGLAISASLKNSASATAEASGKADFDVTMVAVLVDANGVIADCIIDGIAASLAIDAEGKLPAALSAPQTKNELGDAYNMVTYGGAIAEWYQQADALAQFAIGKTVEELKNGAIDETGYAPEGTDLATSATIYLGGYVGAIEKAVANAKALGAQAGDTLKLAALTNVGSSASAAAEAAGNAQLDVDVTALTVNGDTITSCYIDSLQAKVAFDAAGVLAPDQNLYPQTKNELGDGYNMKTWGGAIAEWYEQAASFAAYVTGKTLAQVQGIAVDEGTKPLDADLATSVTIAIGGFQALIAKALQ